MSAPDAKAALPPQVRALIDAALAEDVGPGDWTTLWTFPEETLAVATIVAKADGVISGQDVSAAVFARLDPSVTYSVRVADGAAVRAGNAVAEIKGPARALLTAERVALNFLQRLSGVATVTRSYVREVAGTGAKVIDTRKTTPGMRWLEKRAVAAGGGANHRHGLHDMVLIKDNHIAAAGGITRAVEAVRRHNEAGLKVEVETTELAQVDEALRAGVDRIMFDNMPLSLLRQAVQRVAAAGEGRPETEASGGITRQTIREVAETGVNFISVGALTHSAPALDLSMRLAVVEP